MKGVYEKIKGSGEWYIRYADGTGRIRREKAGTNGTAKLLYHKRKTEVLQGRKLPEKLRARKILFSELADDRLRYLETGAIEELRTDSYRIKLLKDEFGTQPVELSIEQLREWFAEQDWAPETYNRCKTVLSGIYLLGIKNKKVTVNPARLLKRQTPNDGRVRYLSPAEEQALRTAIRTDCPEHEFELDIALHTGMRRSEQYRRISWSNVNFERRDLHVPRSKATRRGRGRHIELNDSALSAFRELCRRTGGKDPIFQHVKKGENGKPLLGPRHWFVDVIEKAKIEDFTWHELRHTFASRLAMMDVSLWKIAQLLGHATIQQTMKYAHLAPSYTLDAVRKLDAFGTSHAVSMPRRTDTKTDTTKNAQFQNFNKPNNEKVLGR